MASGYIRRLVIAAIATLTFAASNGQDAGIWRAGSALKLSGKIYTQCCFVSGPNDQWAYSEKQEMLSLLRESQGWIAREALKYNSTVDFIGAGSLGLTEDIELPSIERGAASGNESVDWVSKVLYRVGYRSTLDFDRWVRDSIRADNYQVVIFVKGKGNPYAMPCSKLMDREKYYVEGAVLYETYNGGEKLASSTIAHEMMHLYGAWDLYKTFNQTEENEQKARELYPNSIMLRTSYNINELDAAEITAWLVGWDNNPKSWYQSFMPLNLIAPTQLSAVSAPRTGRKSR